MEYDLFQKLCTQIATHISRIQKTAQDLALMDVLAGLAHVAEENNYIRPILHPFESPRHLELQGSRHPVIEQLEIGGPFVPNDLALHEDQCRIMLITGPNMAGKSTYMRQIALNVLMAQCGCLIPAQFADMSLVDRIFTRVGASDNLSLGQSTFMVEMNEAAAILNNATQHSLIVLDEIGRGTSTFDGISIACAIIEHLHQLKALTLCATHYHELTQLSSEFPEVQNFRVVVEEEGESIVFLRKIVAGGADKSYGVHVARLAGMPHSVIKRAMSIMKNLEATEMTALSEDSGEDSGNIVQEPGPAKEYQINAQLSLFPEESETLQELKQLNLTQMTPLQALNYLNELQQRLN